MFTNKYIFLLTIIYTLFMIICLLLFRKNKSNTENFTSNMKEYFSSDSNNNTISIADSYDENQVIRVLNNVRVKNRFLNVFQKKTMGSFNPLGQLVLLTKDRLESIEELSSIISKKKTTNFIS